MHRLALAALAVLPTLAAPLRAAAAQAPLVVTGSWLSQHATDARQVIVHAAASRAEYDAGHVPGARLLLFSSYAPTLAGLSSQLPPAALLDSLLEEIGVNDGDRIVIYGQPLQMARLLVTLEHVGLRVASPCSMEAWMLARRRTTSVARNVAVARGSFTQRSTHR
jgi:thiosulfate/3-mercaptopyruvate sulfurtransferase